MMRHKLGKESKSHYESKSKENFDDVHVCRKMEKISLMDIQCFFNSSLRKLS